MTASWNQSQQNALISRNMTDLRSGLMPPDTAVSPWQNDAADILQGQDDVRETDLPQARFKCLDFAVSHEAKTLWCHMKPAGRPNFSHAMLDDLVRIKNAIRCIPPTDRAGTPTLEFFVLASRVPNVFSFGGDLEFFCACIRAGRREHLRSYAFACIDALYANHTGFDRDLTAIGLVQGEALGGGFEAALSCDVIIAERHARFGLPEVRFNLFPGMGAYSFLARRLGGSKAQQLILSGKIFSAAEMAELGIVDVLVDSGDGENAVKEYVARNRGKHRACAAFSRVRRRVNPVTLEELRDVTNIWVDAALQLSEQDMRKMTKIASAQTHW